MLLPILLILIGLILLALGAEGLVRGAASLALRLGVTPLVVGLTIVAFGTGSPELAVSVEAAASGNGTIALGNIVGSNIANIALILGVAAIIRPIHVNLKVLKRQVPLMIAITVLLALMLFSGEINQLEGLLMIAGSIAYVGMTFATARNNRDAIKTYADELPKPTRAVWLDLALTIGGLGVLWLGARALLDGVVAVAQQIGISQVVIALTVVAIGTSLPELATSTIAAFKGEGDLAVGNAIGSNILNILAILGIAALIRPIATNGLRPFDVAALVLSAIVILPIMWRGYVIARWEGALLLIGYAVYMYSLTV